MGLAILLPLKRAAAKPRIDVVALRREVVAVAGVGHARRGGEAGAAQREAVAEPGRGVVPVGVGREAGVGLEAAGGPFPYLAPPEIRPGDGGQLPFRLRGQAPARPAAPGLGLPPGQMGGGGVRVQGLPDAEAAGFPGLSGPAQVARRRGLGGLHIGQVAPPAHRLAVDLEGVHRHRVGGQFVVEGEARSAPAQVPVLAGQGQRGSLRQAGRLPARQVRQGNVQGLGHVHARLAVHVLVEQGQAVEVQAGVGFRCRRQQGQGLLQAGGQVGAGGGEIGQGQVPAAGVGHLAGVVQGIGTRQAPLRPGMVRFAVQAPVPLAVAGDPPVLEPAHVARFPQGRVELRRVGHGQGFAQGGDLGLQQGQGAGATVRQVSGEDIAAAASSGLGGIGGHGTQPENENPASMPQAPRAPGRANETFQGD